MNGFEKCPVCLVDLINTHNDYDIFDLINHFYKCTNQQCLVNFTKSTSSNHINYYHFILHNKIYAIDYRWFGRRLVLNPQFEHNNILTNTSANIMLDEELDFSNLIALEEKLKTLEFYK